MKKVICKKNIHIGSFNFFKAGCVYDVNSEFEDHLWVGLIETGRYTRFEKFYNEFEEGSKMFKYNHKFKDYFCLTMKEYRVLLRKEKLKKLNEEIPGESRDDQAPEGIAARPSMPLSVITSTSMVGLPLESRI